MKRLLALMLCAVSFVMTAQVTVVDFTSYWTLMATSDDLIYLCHDLQDLLSILCRDNGQHCYEIQIGRKRV